MKIRLLMWMSGAALALVGCTTDSSHVSNQSPQNSYDNYPTQSLSQPQQTYDYTPRQEPYPQPAPQYSQPAPPYESQPQQDYARQDDPVPTVDNTQDFEQPLAQHGRWMDTPEYGRVWQPYDQPADWRPYSNDGRWVYTSYGWTWESSQPWGWAAYHYGNWAYRPHGGWVWVPGVVWAPAWVVWRESDDYVAWAPCPPTRGPRFFASIEYCDDVRYNDFVVVERRNFCRPIAPAVVIAPVHNVKIVNKTVNITKIKVVNKVAVNHGPEVGKIEQFTHQRVREEKVGNVVKTPDRFVQKTREEPARRKDLLINSDRENSGREKNDLKQSAKAQATLVPPSQSVNNTSNNRPSGTSIEKPNTGKQEGKQARIIYHNGGQRIDPPASAPRQVEPVSPRESRREERKPVVRQPAPQNRNEPAAIQSETPVKTERKIEKQVPREQQRQTTSTYTPNTQRPANNVPAGRTEHSQQVEKPSRKEQAINRDVALSSDQSVAPIQKNGDGNDKKLGKRDRQNQQQY